MAAVTLTGGVVSMTDAAADKLLQLGQGDPSLLFLALLRHGGELERSRGALGWSQGRLEAAYGALQSVGLVGEAPVLTGGRAGEETAPEYNTADVTAALTGDPAFALLQREMEKTLGILLSPADLKTLYTVYDYLALPPEVILMLTSWCVEETERKYGPGRRPRMSQVKKEACRWRSGGVDTLGAAEEYLRLQKGLRDRERTILPMVGIRDRAPLDKEREYMAAWVDWGFSDGAIQMAYERTLMKKQSMSWPYMNSILKSWHAKGLHTPREIEKGDGQAKAAVSAAGRQSRPRKEPGGAARELAQLRRAMEKED